MEANGIILYLIWIFLLMAMVLAMYRLIKGPHVNDRIVAMDLMASIVMGFILVYSVIVRKGIYFDVAVVISLISFMGTIAISSYLRLKR